MFRDTLVYPVPHNPTGVLTPPNASHICINLNQSQTSNQKAKSRRRHRTDVVALRALAWLLRVAGHDLDLISLDGLASVIHLERHVLDEECPDFVAESIRI